MCLYVGINDSYEILGLLVNNLDVMARILQWVRCCVCIHIGISISNNFSLFQKDEPPQTEVGMCI